MKEGLALQQRPLNKPFPNNKFYNNRLLHIERVLSKAFKFDENGRNFSKRIENTMGKREIASYEQFLLFPKFFQKTFAAYI